MTRAGKRSWLAALLSLLLLVTMVAPALAQPPALTSEDAIRFLVEHKIVQGDEQGNLNLDKTITRAELAKVVVVAKGGADLVPILAPLVSFADSKGHWGAGYIEAAARMGLVRGRDANTFDPNAPITYAEALTILLRMVDQEPLVWSPAAVMQRAAQLGIIQGSSLELIANLPAPRGAVFESLTRTMVQVPLADGSTLAKQLDADPPALTVSAPASTAADKVTVAGTATGAYAVTVNGTAATLVDGKFTAEVSLNPGANTITVVAYDVAGNQTTQTVTVVRGGDVAAISVSGPTSVKAGESVTLTLRPTDAQGNVLPGSVLTATVSDGMGTMDTATGRFTAGTKAGRATITFTASTGVTETYEINVLGLAADAEQLRIRTANLANGLTVGKQWKVEVEVLGDDGSPLTYDDGRLITLEVSGLEGVSPTRSTARTSAGVATFLIMGSIEGHAMLRASSTGLEADELTVAFTSSHRIVLTADPSSAIADGTSVINIRATLQDEDGRPVVNNTGSDILLTLDVSDFDGYIGNRYLVIRRGTSSSAGYDGDLIAGYEAGTVKIDATVTSNHKFTVVPVNVSFRKLVIGTAAKFEIAGGSGTWVPGATVNLTVRVTDSNGNTVPDGEYAFQVKVTTTNPGEPVQGLPPGVDLTLGNTGYVPVDDPDYGVVARTVNGIARLTLSYDRSGSITLQVVGAKATDEAYDDQGWPDEARAGTGLTSAQQTIRFVGTAAKLNTVVDLPAAKLVDQQYGVLAADGKSTATVKVYVLDAKNGWLQNATPTVTLTRKSGTGAKLANNQNSQTVVAKGGVAEFKIVATKDVGITEFEATSGSLTAAKIEIYTNSDVPDQPEILSIIGDKSKVDNRITPSDTGMIIDIKAQPGEIGYVKVFRVGSNTPIFTSDVISLSGSPAIFVPKDKLRVSDRYTIRINNGAGDSPASPEWPYDPSARVVVERPYKVNITSVVYDANADQGTKSQLVVTASGVSSSGRIDESKVFLYDRATKKGDPLSTLGFTCLTSNGRFTCTVNGTDFLTPGDWILDTEDGWYVRDASGDSAVRDEHTTDNRLTPMPLVERATISFNYNSAGDVTGGTLVLEGKNLKDGTIGLENVKIGGQAVGSGTTTAQSATRATISLTKDSAQALEAGGGTLTLNVGWMYSGTSSAPNDSPSQSGITVLLRPNVTGVQYVVTKDDQGENKATLTISGSGFAGATVNAQKLLFVDRRGDPIPALAGVTGSLPPSVTPTTAGTFVIDFTSLWQQLEPYKGEIYITGEEGWLTLNGWDSEPMGRYRLSWTTP